MPTREELINLDEYTVFEMVKSQYELLGLNTLHILKMNKDELLAELVECHHKLKAKARRRPGNLNINSNKEDYYGKRQEDELT